MNDVMSMQMLHGGYHLSNVTGSSRLVELSHLLEERIQLPSGCILHNDVDLTLIKEKTIHPQYVRMIQMTVDF